MQIQSYVFFNGTCGDAIAYYQDVLGAEELFRMRFGDAPPDPQRPPLAAPPVPQSAGQPASAASAETP